MIVLADGCAPGHYYVRANTRTGINSNLAFDNGIRANFNIIGELSRTLALAVRLFGNVMSGAKIGGVLLALTPLLFPVVMQLFGLVTGLIQAYIFAILAMVYIASATRSQKPAAATNQETAPEGASAKGED